MSTNLPPLQPSLDPLLQPPLESIKSPNKTKKILIIAGLVLLVIIIIISIIIGIVKGMKTSKQSSNNTIINTKSVNLNNTVTRSTTLSSVNTRNVSNTRSSHVSLNDTQAYNNTTINRSGNTSVKVYTPPLNENYILAHGLMCDGKTLLGSMTLDEGINKCNNCIGLQRIDNIIFKCDNLITSEEPDTDVWMNKNLTDNTKLFANSLNQSGTELIPTGDNILYNKYYDYIFNYDNAKNTYGSMLWLNAVDLCNNNINCIGIEFNGTGINSIPITINPTDNIYINNYVKPEMNSNKIIYLKNKIISQDGLPLITNPLTDVISLP